MGMIKCSVHGLAHIVTCCVHIARAAAAGIHEKAHVVLDDWLTPSIVCERCERLVSAAPRSTQERQVGFDHVLESPLVPCCDECMEAWFSATGQGDLLEAVDRAKAQKSKPGA